MGNKTLIYKQKVLDVLDESFLHLKRLNTAFEELQKSYCMPINTETYQNILDNPQNLAFSDQIIYRFSKLQDTIGAKLFKSILLYQGENVDKPFLDILNRLEKMEIVDVDEWFEIRELRNQIAHEYENSDKIAIDILNSIYELKTDLEKLLNCVVELLNLR